MFNKYYWGIIIFKKKISKVVIGYYISKFVVIIINNIIITFQSSQNTLLYKFIEGQISKDCIDTNTIHQFQELKDKLSQNLMIVLVVFAWFYVLIEPNVWYVLVNYVFRCTQNSINQPGVENDNCNGEQKYQQNCNQSPQQGNDQQIQMQEQSQLAKCNLNQQGNVI